MECLKLDGWDAVDMCMDRLEPWLEITDTGEFSFSLNAVNGFIGGSVGVVGTVVAANIKKGEVKERLKCTYCDGSGQIICGHCFGLRKIVPYDSDVTEDVDCSNCEA